MENIATEHEESVGAAQTEEYKAFLKMYTLPRNNKHLPIHERKQATHTNPYIAMSYHIPNDKLPKFWQLYLRELQNGRRVCICEVCYEDMLVHPFLDLDEKNGGKVLNKANLKRICVAMKQIVKEMCVITNNRQLHTLILRNSVSGGAHVIMSRIGITRRDLYYLWRRLRETLPRNLAETVDFSTGLRFAGAGKTFDNPEGSSRPTNLRMDCAYLPVNTTIQQLTSKILEECSIIATQQTMMSPAYLEKREQVRLKHQRELDKVAKEWNKLGIKLSEESFMILLDGLAEKASTEYWNWLTICTAISCLVTDKDMRNRLIHYFSKKSLTRYIEPKVDDWIDNYSEEAITRSLERACKNEWNPLVYIIHLVMRDSGSDIAKDWCKKNDIVFPHNAKRTLKDILDKARSGKRVDDVELIEGAEIRSEKTIQDIRIRRRIYLLKAAMGMGKTKALIRYIRQLPEHYRILCLSPRRSLTRELRRKLGFVSYLDKKGKLGISADTRRVICSIESLSRVEPIQWDLVIMDEYRSVMRQVTSSTLRIEPQIAIGIVENLIRHTKNIIGIDADFKKEDIDFLERILGKDTLEQDLQVVQYTYKPHVGDKYELWSNKELWRQQLTQDLMNNKRIAIATTSKDESKKLAAWITKDFPNKRIKLYNRDTDEAIKKRDFEDLKTALKDVDVLIYTPTMSHGCSYEEQGYNVVYAYFPGKSQVEYTTCLQMLYRVRDISEKRYVLLLDKGCMPEYCKLPEDRKELEQMIRKRSTLVKWGLDNGNLMQTPGEDYDSVEYPMKGFYYELYLHNTLESNASRNDLTKLIIDGLVELGGDIVVMDETEQVVDVENPSANTIAIIASRVEQRGREVALEEAHEIATARDVTDAEYDLLAKRVFSSINPLTKEEMTIYTKTKLRKHYSAYTPTQLTKEWVLVNNDEKRKEAYTRQFLRGMKLLSSKQCHEGMLKQYKNVLLIPQETLQAKVVEEIVELIGLRSAAIIDQIITREQVQNGVNYMNGHPDVEQRVLLAFGHRDGRSRRNGKKWTVRNFLSWLNVLMEKTYLTSLVTHSQKNRSILSYIMTSLYKQP